MSWIGIDVGGTFTDAVVFDGASGTLRSEKSPTTPDAPQEGVLAVLERLGVDLSSIERLVHGLTLATNTVLEGKGTEVWVITNRGFRDTLEIARTNRPVLYNIKTLKAPPLARRDRVIEISERMLADGSILRPLDSAELDAAVEALRAGGAKSVAVCLLHSYANPENERRVAEHISRQLPDCFVTYSADVLPEFREYERFSTAVLNGYTGPRVGRYLKSLSGALATRGHQRSVFIMTSNGGIFTADRAARFPVNTILSGPAGGVAASAALGEALGIRNLITYDMGGTSTDVCLLEDLVVPVTNEQFISEYPNRTPQIEINTVGAGGGSIAWLDAGPILRVGPQSAGAKPGPACYGGGGEEPTVTDANLLLGRLRAGATLGGSVQLQAGLAEKVVTDLAQKVGKISTKELGEGIIRIAVARMVSAIKEVSIGKGHDPREFALLAYGGAGPMHAVLIAEEMEIPRVVIPPNPGNFSAYGAILSDVRHDHVRTRRLALDKAALPVMDGIFRELADEARAGLKAEGADLARVTMRRQCGMRYVGQSWELVVDLPETLDLSEMVAAFNRAHEARYGHASDEAIELVNFRLIAVGETSKPEFPEWTVGGALEDAIDERRDVFMDGRQQRVPVYIRSLLPGGAEFAGPAIVDEEGSVTVLPAGWQCRVTQFGVLIADKEA